VGFGIAVGAHEDISRYERDIAAEGGPVAALELGESFPSAYEVVRPLFPELSSICGTSLDSFDTGLPSSLYQCASTNA
jgi:hypothetical protein